MRPGASPVLGDGVARAPELSCCPSWPVRAGSGPSQLRPFGARPSVDPPPAAIPRTGTLVPPPRLALSLHLPVHDAAAPAASPARTQESESAPPEVPILHALT